MSATAKDSAGRLAAVPPDQRHSVLIRSLADLFSVVPEHLPEDLDRFEALFRPLYREAAPVDRLHVVKGLARRRDLPDTVAEDILRDAGEIADLYLTTAPAVSETALLNTVARGTPDQRRAIARRPNLAETVVLALLVTGEDEVVAELADNLTALIPQNLIVELEAEADVIARPPAPDTAVPEPAPDLSEAAETFFGLDEEARFHALTAFIAGTAFRQVETAGHVPRRPAPPDLFARAVAGDRDGVASDLARALDIARPLADRIVADAGGEPLAIALAALGLDGALATSLLLWLLPEDSRTYWRLGLLRDLHERAGWRGGLALIEDWRGPPAARPAEPARPPETIIRPQGAVALRRRILRPSDLAKRA